MIDVLRRREGSGTERHSGKTCEVGGTDWRDAAASQEVPRIASSSQELRERRGMDSPLEPSGGQGAGEGMALLRLGSGLPAPRTVRERILLLKASGARSSVTAALGG